MVSQTFLPSVADQDELVANSGDNLLKQILEF